MNKLELSRKKRYKVYQEALEIFDQDDNVKCLCPILYQVLRDMYNIRGSVLANLPEFAKYRPKETIEPWIPWWPTTKEYIEVRRQVLMNCKHMSR